MTGNHPQPPLQTLLPHPDSLPPPDTRVTASASREGQWLCLRYRVRCTRHALWIPVPAAPARRDGLWRGTCCEAFVRPVGTAGYLEFNLSPSTQWAAYAFADYRGEPRPWPCAPPRFRCRSDEEGFELSADLQLPGGTSAGTPGDFAKDFAGDWDCALTVVLQDHAGGLSYWSLRHPPGAADFHHAANFVASLPARPARAR